MGVSSRCTAQKLTRKTVRRISSSFGISMGWTQGAAHQAERLKWGVQARPTASSTQILAVFTFTRPRRVRRRQARTTTTRLLQHSLMTCGTLPATACSSSTSMELRAGTSLTQSSLPREELLLGLVLGFSRSKVTSSSSMTSTVRRLLAGHCRRQGVETLGAQICRLRQRQRLADRCLMYDTW